MLLLLIYLFAFYVFCIFSSALLLFNFFCVFYNIGSVKKYFSSFPVCSILLSDYRESSGAHKLQIV